MYEVSILVSFIILILLIACCASCIFVSEKFKVVLYHKLKLKQGIILEDCDGEVYYTFKEESPFNKSIAFIFPSTKVGHVVLNKDGTTSGSSIYIERWKDL